MPESPQLAAFNVKEQQLQSVRSLRMSSHVVERTNFGLLDLILYQQSYFLGHYPKLLTMGEERIGM